MDRVARAGEGSRGGWDLLFLSIFQRVTLPHHDFGRADKCPLCGVGCKKEMLS